MSHAILNKCIVVKATQGIYGKCKTNTVLNTRVMGYAFADTTTATYLEGHAASSPHECVCVALAQSHACTQGSTSMCQNGHRVCTELNKHAFHCTPTDITFLESCLFFFFSFFSLFIFFWISLFFLKACKSNRWNSTTCLVVPSLGGVNHLSWEGRKRGGRWGPLGWNLYKQVREEISEACWATITLLFSYLIRLPLFSRPQFNS